MGYGQIERRLQQGGIVILDGGIGTELQRRGVPMDPQAWCGPASLDNADVLERVHRDYIDAGADILTANTFASSRLMLEAAGFGERFEAINRTAVDAAKRARDASGRSDLAIAGSLSHMCPIAADSVEVDAARAPSEATMAAAFEELAVLLRDLGCDLILLEMMFDPKRVPIALKAAQAAGLPVWAGFAARRGADGRVLSYVEEREVGLDELLRVLDDVEVQAAGVMHTPANLIGDALDVVRSVFTGPLTAYPDSGYFTMPDWHFENVIPPAELHRFATDWVGRGAQVIGGCCGLSPEHIEALAPLKDARPT